MGKNVLQPKNIDFKLTSMVLSHSSSEVSSIGLIIAIPALLTRISIFLYLSKVLLLTSAQPSGEVTSCSIKKASPFELKISSSTFFPPSTSISVRITFAPSLAKAIDIDLPRLGLDAPPVTTAILLSNLPIIFPYIKFLCGLKNLRISSIKTFGSSMGAKCPPDDLTFQY